MSNNNAQYPAPVMPKNGKTSKYSNTTFIANPHLKGRNPRQPGTHGHRFHSLVLKAGDKGITYEALREQVEADPSIKGFSNHLAWDLERNFIVIKR